MTQTSETPPSRSPFDRYLGLTVALSVFAMAPLAYPGYFETHSGFLSLWSITALRREPFNLSWLPVLAEFNPWRSGGLIPYYVAALMPLSALNAAKLLSAGGILAGASGLYLWLKSWVGSKGACVAALVYTYAPFHVAALYVRGAWAESFFWGILPWALLGATYLVAVPRPPIMVIAVAFWVLLSGSQLGLAFIAWLVVVAMQLLFHRPQAKWPIAMSLVGWLIAAALTLLRSYNILAPPVQNLRDHLLYPAQLIIPFWGYGLSQAGWDDGLSLSLGLPALGLAMLALLIWGGGPDKRPYFFLGVALVMTLLMLPIAGLIWSIPGLNLLLSYPWQLLGFAVLGLAVLAGVAFWLEPRLHPLPIFGSVVLLVLLAAYPHLEPRFITETPIPTDPQAIYGDNQLLLIDHRFVIANPAEYDPLNPQEPYLPLDDTPLQAGDTLHLQVTWQAVRLIDQNYMVFAQLLDAEGNRLAQVDTQPQEYDRPTSSWRPGELVFDQYSFTLPAGSPPPAQVWLGFYTAENFERLPALDDDEGRAILHVR